MWWSYKGKVRWGSIKKVKGSFTWKRFRKESGHNERVNSAKGKLQPVLSITVVNLAKRRSEKGGGWFSLCTGENRKGVLQ